MVHFTKHIESICYHVQINQRLLLYSVRHLLVSYMFSLLADNYNQTLFQNLAKFFSYNKPEKEKHTSRRD